MNEKHADQGYRGFWSTMKNMTWKERVKHFLFYYGKYAILAIILIYVVCDVAYEALIKEKPEVLLSGTAVNVKVSLELEDALTEDAFVHMGGTDEEKQEIKLAASYISYTDFIGSTAMQTKLLSGEYDYAIMDQTGLDMLAPMEAFPDMNLLLPAEKLELWKERFAYVRMDGVDYPVAINITGMPITEGMTYTGEYVYFAFCVNDKRAEVAEPFYDYLVEAGLLIPDA